MLTQREILRAARFTRAGEPAGRCRAPVAGGPSGGTAIVRLAVDPDTGEYRFLPPPRD